jgi:hypothetical protein
MDAPHGFTLGFTGGQALVAEAVEKERKRVRPKSVPEPMTALGKEINQQTCEPTSFIDRIVSIEAEKALKEFRPGESHIDERRSIISQKSE